MLGWFSINYVFFGVEVFFEGIVIGVEDVCILIIKVEVGEMSMICWGWGGSWSYIRVV